MLGEPIAQWEKRDNPNIEAYEGTLMQDGNNFVGYAHVVNYSGVYLVEVSCYDNMSDFSNLRKAACMVFNVPFVTLHQAKDYANETMLHMVIDESFRKVTEVNNEN